MSKREVVPASLGHLILSKGRDTSEISKREGDICQFRTPQSQRGGTPLKSQKGGGWYLPVWDTSDSQRGGTPLKSQNGRWYLSVWDTSDSQRGGTPLKSQNGRWYLPVWDTSDSQRGGTPLKSQKGEVISASLGHLRLSMID